MSEAPLRSRSQGRCNAKSFAGCQPPVAGWPRSPSLVSSSLASASFPMAFTPGVRQPILTLRAACGWLPAACGWLVAACGCWVMCIIIVILWLDIVGSMVVVPPICTPLLRLPTTPSAFVGPLSCSTTGLREAAKRIASLAPLVDQAPLLVTEQGRGDRDWLKSACIVMPRIRARTLVPGRHGGPGSRDGRPWLARRGLWAARRQRLPETVHVDSPDRKIPGKGWSGRGTEATRRLLVRHRGSVLLLIITLAGEGGLAV